MGIFRISHSALVARPVNEFVAGFGRGVSVGATVVVVVVVGLVGLAGLGGVVLIVVERI